MADAKSAKAAETAVININRPVLNQVSLNNWSNATYSKYCTVLF